MTVCATLDAGSFVAVLSDCIVTNRSTGTMITPANVGISAGTPALLVRKSYLFENESSAFGFAGDVSTIKGFMESFPTYFKHGRPKERPLRWVCDRVNEYNLDVRSPEREMSMIGFSVVHDNPHDEVHWISRLRDKSLKFSVGTIRVTGSGADEMIKNFATFDQNFFIEYDNPSVRLACAIGQLNTLKIFDNPSTNIAKTWGGYIEMTGYDRLAKRWLTLPPWVHVCYQLDLTNPKEVLVGKVSKVALYKSDLNGSYLVVCWQKTEDGNWDSFNWRISSGLILENSEPNAFHLREFNPMFGTVLFRVIFNGRSYCRYTTLNGHLMDYLNFQVLSENSFNYSISEEYLRSVIEDEYAYIKRVDGKF